MSITYHTGNIFDATTDAVVVTVNCVGVMGKGIALECKQRYPNVFTKYQLMCKNGMVQIGQNTIAEVTNSKNAVQDIILFPTKEHWRHGSKLHWIAQGLDDLVELIKQEHLSSITIPPLGCGNGGLHWPSVDKLIQLKLITISAKCDIHIYPPDMRK